MGSLDNALQFLTQAAFVVVFLITLVDLARHRRRHELEVATLFGTLGLVILLQGLSTLTGIKIPGADIVGGLLILAQPYLLLRLVEHFRPVPRLQHAIGLVLLGISWALMLVVSASGPRQQPQPWVTLPIILAFAYVEGYATFAFVQAIFETRGVTRRRLIAVAAGSGLLAFVILLAGVTAFLPDKPPLLTALSSVVALGSAASYYVGFALPNWLKNAWQMAELRRFMGSLSGRSAEERVVAALDQLGPSAVRAVGGKAAVVAVGKDAHWLELHPDDENRAQLSAAGLKAIVIGPHTPVLSRAWDERRPVLVSDLAQRDPEVFRIAEAFGGARSAFVVPLVIEGQPQGLLIVLSERSPLFLYDELGVLALLVELVAPAIEIGQLYADVERRANVRQALLDMSRAVAAENDVGLVADRIVSSLDAVLPVDGSRLLLARPDGSLAMVATWGTSVAPLSGNGWPESESAAAEALRSGKPCRVEVAANGSRGRATLALPLRRNEAVLGVLVLESSEADAFDDAQTEMAEIVGSHAALSLARAQLVEELRSQNGLMELANRHKSEFLASMSHELRTPLNAILGFSDLLMSADEDEYDAEERGTYLETIHGSGQHLLTLINDILDLAKVEAGKMSLHCEPLQLEQLIRQVCSTLAPLAAAKRINVVADVDPAVVLQADGGKVKQVLYNLMSNAIKFTPEDGRVTVSAHSTGDTTQIAVTDTGIGIAAEDRERVFAEFQQLDTGPGRHYEGTGLGLTLTKRLVELHGGRIWVDSTPGQGTTFTVALPSVAAVLSVAGDSVGLATDRMGAPDLPEPMNVNGPLVLVVEDDDKAANLLSLYLGKAGYRTTVAGDGGQAIDKATTLHPVAITLDILLPGLDGWEVLRALKVNESTRDIPVMIISVVDDPSLGTALGAVDYLVKPVDRQMLLSRVERLALGNAHEARNLRVLIVDDEPTSVDLLETTVAQAGFTPIRALGGAEGIDLARGAQPDLILLDLMMPTVSGFDVVTALKEDPATRRIPIMIVTAKDLTPEDKFVLNGRVAAIFQKGDLAQMDLISWLHDVNRLPPTVAA